VGVYPSCEIYRFRFSVSRLENDGTGKEKNMVHLTADRMGTVKKEHSMQDRLLGVLYGTKAGRRLLKPLVAPCASRIGARLLDTRASLCLAMLLIL